MRATVIFALRNFYSYHDHQHARWLVVHGSIFHMLDDIP